MKKLQRYHYIELANTYLEDAIPNDKVYCRPKDVSALEAENENLRAYANHHCDCARWGYEGQSCGIMDVNAYEPDETCTCGLDAILILNREQEKQP